MKEITYIKFLNLLKSFKHCKNKDKDVSSLNLILLYFLIIESFNDDYHFVKYF
jgi:hypothetical protein